MQTYHSALPLIPSDLLLSQKYSIMSRPSLKSSGSRYSQIIENPRIKLKILTHNNVYGLATSGETIALSFYHECGIALFNTRTGNEIGSRIPTTSDRHSICFSFDGQWLATRPANQDPEHALDIWNVQTRTRTSTTTIEKRSYDFPKSFTGIKYSASGEKVMLTSFNVRSVANCFILDTKTNKPLQKLKSGPETSVAISPDGSQIAIGDKSSIKLIDVDTGHLIGREITLHNDGPRKYYSTKRLSWSRNGQFLAFASVKLSEHPRQKDSVSAIEIYLLSFTSSAQVPSLSLLGNFTEDSLSNVTFSPDSSKVVVALHKYRPERAIFFIWCTRSASLIGRTSFDWIKDPLIFFSADGRDILHHVSYYGRTIYRFNVVPTYLEIYMDYPPKFDPSQIPHTIEYSHYISGGTIDDYASHVDADGWIFNMKGEREIWTPWANYEVLCSCQPPQKGQTQYRTLKVQDPETKTVVLIYVISFERKDVNNGIQEEAASVDMTWRLV